MRQSSAYAELESMDIVLEILVKQVIDCIAQLSWEGCEESARVVVVGWCC